MKKEKTRDKILIAAQSLFQEKGYDGVRMQEIADKAQINKGLLHYYFKTKDNIFQEVFNIAFSTLVMRLKSTMSKDLGLEDKIDLIIEDYIHVLSQNRYLPGFIIQEINRNSDFINSKFKRIKSEKILEKFMNQVNQERENGRIIEIDGINLILNVLSMTIFPFVASKMIEEVFNVEKEKMNHLLISRKQIISDFVKRAIIVEK
jgi:AcrR family transcriptional regulator